MPTPFTKLNPAQNLIRKKSESRIALNKQSAALLLILTAFMSLLSGATYANGLVLADMSNDYAGTQGSKNWYYGSAAAPTTYNAQTDFEQMPNFGAFAPNNYDVVWFHAQNNWAMITKGYMHPNVHGTNGVFAPRWAIQRWQCPYSGTIHINGSARATSAHSAGFGPTFAIYVNGVLLHTVDLQTTASSPYSVTTSVSSGALIDFVVKARGNSQANDNTAVSGTIQEVLPSSTFTGTGVVGSATFDNMFNPRGVSISQTSTNSFYWRWPWSSSLRVETADGGFPGSNYGRSLFVDTTGTFQGILGSFPKVNLKPYETLRLSFNARFASIPTNYNGGFRFGFTSSNSPGSAVFYAAGTGGSTNRSFYLDVPSQFAPAAGTQIIGISTSGTGFQSLANIGQFPCNFWIYRDGISSYRLTAATATGVWQTATLTNAGFNEFDTVFIRQAATSVDYYIDNVAVDVLAPPADLSVSSVIIPHPSNPLPGDALSIPVLVKNYGGSDAVSCHLRINISIGEVKISEVIVAVPAIQAGREHLVTAYLQLPTNAIPGTYLISLLLDENRLNQESNVSNNQNSIHTVSVGREPAFRCRLIFEQNSPFNIIKVSPFFTELSAPYDCFAYDGEMEHADTSELFGAHPLVQQKVREHVLTSFRASKIDNVSVEISSRGHPGCFNIYFVKRPMGVTSGGQAEAIYRFNSKGSGDACVFASRDSRDEDSYAKWLAFGALHECGHLMGLPHLASGSTTVVEDEIMDYSISNVYASSLRFTNRKHSYCRSYNAATHPTAPSQCNSQAVHTQINPQYHLRRYVNEESATALAADQLEGGSYDLPDQKWYGIRMTNSAANDTLRQIRVCRVGVVGLEDAITMTEINRLEHLSELNEIITGDDALAVFGQHSLGGRAAISSIANPTSSEDLFLRQEAVSLFLIRFAIDGTVISSQPLSGAITELVPNIERYMLQVENGVVSHSLTLNPGKDYIIQSTADLIHWSDKDILLKVPSRLQWHELLPVNTKAFYRVLRRN